MSKDDMGGDDKDIYIRLGSLTASVSGLKEAVNGFTASVERNQERSDQKFEKIQHELVALNGNTVKQGQCESRAQTYTGVLKDAVVELKTEIAKKRTRDDHPAVRLASPDLTGSIKTLATEAPTSWVGKLRDRIGLVIAMVTLLGVVVVGVIKVSKFVVTMDGMIKRQEKAYKKPKVIYIYHGDSGVVVNRSKRR